MNTFIQPNSAGYDAIADALVEHGYCILPQFLAPELNTALYQRVLSLDEQAFQQAGVGRDTHFQLNQTIRRDHTYWLSDSHPIDMAYLEQMSAFRLAINQRLFMGLFDYESHYALYPPGAFYKKHVDAFKGQSSRILTTVLYLNPDWQDSDGGQLLLYRDDAETLIATVNPDFATFVVFLSERFPHEVVKSHRDRYSIAGWFRLQDPLQPPAL